MEKITDEFSVIVKIRKAIFFGNMIQLILRDICSVFVRPFIAGSCGVLREIWRISSGTPQETAKEYGRNKPEMHLFDSIQSCEINEPKLKEIKYIFHSL